MGRHAGIESVPGTKARRTGRGYSRDLGEYVEYGEPWLRSLAFITASALLSMYAATPDRSDAQCNPWGWCGPAAVEAMRSFQGLVFLGLAFLTVVLVWRRLVRSPGIRIGTLGIENRTGILRVTHVRWESVRGSSGSWSSLGWHFMAVQITTGQGFTNLRISGLSRPWREIERAVKERVEAETATRRATWAR